jgi:hypothetical protein
VGIHALAAGDRLPIMHGGANVGLVDWGDAGLTLLSIAGARDIIIIATGSLAILLLIALFAFTVVIGLSIRALLKTVQSMLKDDVTPLLTQSRETVLRVKGTATFISENAAAPVIRVYGAVAGGRRLLGVLSGASGKRKKAK